MPRYDELKTVRKLSDRGDTNSVVHLVKEANADNLYVRKVIFGIEQPLYQGIFLREVQALYKLNNCDNIVKIISHRNMVYTDAATKVKERVGCIFLEYISGETLAKTNISRLTSKQKFKIIKQLLSAIETAHYNGIIHRDINPNNIMIDDNGDVKVIDFGICKIKQKQLPPVLDTEIIQANKSIIRLEDLTEGLFEKLYNSFPEDNKHRLTIQYRMHPVIGSLISKVFYDNEIQNGIEKEQRITGIPFYDNVAIEWISTSKLPSYKRNEKRVGDESNATYKNNAELEIIKSKLRELDSLASRPIKVGVITAYRAQKSAIKDMIRQQNFNQLQVEVDTVDAFQGGQKEIIIYSTVRSSDKSTRIGFLKSEARLNVSLSRAQSLLIIVGDLDFLNNTRIHGNKFPEIIEYIDKTDGCKITLAGVE